MNASELRVEKWSLEVQSERSSSAGRQARTLRDLSGGMKHLIPRTRHDRWQECGDSVRGGVGAQRFERVERITIEPRTADAVDVKIDEARRHRAPERKLQVEKVRAVVD